MTLYFIFMDGVGFGEGILEANPLFANEHPFLDIVLGGSGWELGVEDRHTLIADLYRLDATLGVSGLPQSATGQTVLLTGINVPALIGEHYGPKPDQRVAQFLKDGGIIGELAREGKTAALVNAYPPVYFEGINSGKRLYSAFPLAMTKAGFRLYDDHDLSHGKALSADITGELWNKFFHAQQIPLRTPEQSGRSIVLSHLNTDLVIFEYWLTDHAGHKQNHGVAKQLLTAIDSFLQGVFDTMKPEDMILITSDHGNMEDMQTRRHTYNPVPLILIGDTNSRQKFKDATSLLDVVPGIRKIFLV